MRIWKCILEIYLGLAKNHLSNGCSTLEKRNSHEPRPANWILLTEVQTWSHSGSKCFDTVSQN